MATTWSGTWQLKEQIQAYLNDKSFDTGGSKVDLLLVWANKIVNEITAEIDFRHLLNTDYRSITTANYQWLVPKNYQKRSKRFTKVRVGDDYIEEKNIEDLFALDPDHADITTDTKPQCFALDGNTIYFYPKWAGTITLENYYRYPEPMVNVGDSPDIPGTVGDYDSTLNDLIVAGVIGKYGFPMLGEFELAKFWYNREIRKGQFFDLLELYRKTISKSNTELTNQVKYY